MSRIDITAAQAKRASLDGVEELTRQRGAEAPEDLRWSVYWATRFNAPIGGMGLIDRMQAELANLEKQKHQALDEKVADRVERTTAFLEAFPDLAHDGLEAFELSSHFVKLDEVPKPLKRVIRQDIKHMG